MRKSLKFSGLALAAMMLVACTGEPASPGGDAEGPIKIGIILDTSGPVTPYGVKALDGAKILVDQVNADGGVDGRQIEIVFEDTASDRANVANAMRKVDGEGVVAILGPGPSSLFALAAPLAKQQQLAIVGPHTGEAFADGVMNEWTFRIPPVNNAALLKEVIGEYQKVYPFKRLAVFMNPQNNASTAETAILEELAKSEGFEIVANVSVPEGQTDVRAVVSQVADAAPDAIWMSHLVNENVTFMKQARQRGIDVPFIGGPNFQSAEMFNLAAAEAEGSLTYVPFVPGGDNPRAQYFEAEWAKISDEDVDSFSVLAYDAMLALVTAIDIADSLDRTAIREALAALDGVEGAMGLITFAGGNGDNKTPAFNIMRVQGGVLAHIR